MSELTVRIDNQGQMSIPMLRIGGVESITPVVLIEVADLCFKQYMASEGDDKLSWHMFYRNAESIVNEDVCPESGAVVLGHFALESFVIPKAGDVVTVAKGAQVRSTHPSFEHKGKPAARRQQITVHRTSHGYVDFDHGVRIVNPEVRWAGVGGYWK